MGPVELLVGANPPDPTGTGLRPPEQVLCEQFPLMTVWLVGNFCCQRQWAFTWQAQENSNSKFKVWGLINACCFTVILLTRRELCWTLGGCVYMWRIISYPCHYTINSQSQTHSKDTALVLFFCFCFFVLYLLLKGRILLLVLFYCWSQLKNS